MGAGGFGPASGHDDAPTQPLSVGGGAGERCINCGAPLASDQRYCVNCGERRGKPRFEVAESAEPAGEYVTVSSMAPPPPRRPRTSSGLNLIAGVATLLLAMGVGVLIGHNSAGNSKNTGTPATQVITVGGGAATTSGSAATTSGASGSGSGASSHHGAKGNGGSSHASAAKVAPKVVIQKAAAAASKVTGGNAPTAAPTVTQGGSCSSGQAGCQGGKFTGNNFFGQ
jgi:hypothetical protein